MKKFIFIFNIISMFLIGHLYSMEVVPFVQKQNIEEKVKEYFTETLPELKLTKICKTYCVLSENCRNKMIVRMSDNLLLLHRVALWLPKDVQRHIVVQMFGGDRETAKIFYKDKIEPAFAKYQKIISSVKDSNMSINSLYKMSPHDLDVALNKIDPWYGSYFNPIMSIEEQKQIHEDIIIRPYFEGKDVIILPEEEEHFCTCRRMSAIAGGSTAAGAATAGGIFSVGACVGGQACICETSFLALVLGFSLGIIPCVGCTLATVVGMSTLASNAKKVTFEVPENLNINDDV